MSQSSDDRGVMPRMQPVKYIAELEHVREVSIACEGDLQFWQDYLRRHELVPLSRDGRAHILIVAAKMRYMGLLFSEVSFSVEVVNPLNTEVPAAFLISAFNSSRLFAWSERLFFRTPYVRAGCDMQLDPPAAWVDDGHARLFEASMGSDTLLARAGETIDGWEGVIFLDRQAQRRRRFYFAKLQGGTIKQPFSPDRDRFACKPSSAHPVFEMLVNSRCTPVEWIIRGDALHARSKTCHAASR